jgi:hypothetical protein
MFDRLERATRNILMVIILFSFTVNFFELSWINHDSPYYFLPILFLAVSNIAIQIISKRKKKRVDSIDA